MSNNIIDSIKVSGVTYEIQGSGGITIDPTLDSGSTNPVANSAITTALDAKVNVADNEVSGLTLAFNIGARETYTIGDNITKLTIKSTVSIGSGSRIVSFYIYHITGGSQINCSVKYTYQSNWINAINSTSGNFTATLNNGVIDITLDSGYYFFYINSINSFAVIGYKNYSGGQSARVIEGSVSEALSEVSVKIPPISVVDVDMYHGNNGTLNLERRYSSGTSWMNHSIPLNDEKTLKYDTYTGLYVNFKGQSAHTNTLNTDSGNYCYIPSVAASYDYAYDSITVRANSAYTGSSASFNWTISGISEDGGAYVNVYVYDKTSNTVTLTSRSFEVDVTQNGYYFTFTANNSQSPSDPIKLSQFREGNCSICGTGSTIPNAYIIDLVQALTYEYNGQEVIDDIYSKLDTKQTTLTAGTGIDITNNVISATGGGGGGKAIEAGRGISVTTGETADTISFSLPISAGTGTDSIVEGSSNIASGAYSHAEGLYTSAATTCSHTEGQGTQALSSHSHAEGQGTIARGRWSHAEGYNSVANGTLSHVNGYEVNSYNHSETSIGRHNNSVSASTTFGDSGNTLFSVGNGTSANARHNAFEVRQNGDIYLSSGGTDIKLQDHLGGGGVDVVQTTGTSTTDVMSQNAVTTQLGRFVTVAGDQAIRGKKIFTYSDNSGKAIEFKQTDDSSKVGFSIKNSALTNNELASFELRPNTFTIDGVQHPLLYFGHYRNKNTANAGVPQTVIGYRQYDQKNAAAYHYLMPLPEKAKAPFSLTTSFKDYYAPMGFKNGSTMITADNTGVVDLSSELGGLKLVKLSQAEYNALATKDSSTLYIIVN